jgi:hypothetical protein
MARNRERARLEANVVQAALAQRRAELRCQPPYSGEPGVYVAAETARDVAWGWYTAAVDVLLAFLEENDAKDS